MPVAPRIATDATARREKRRATRNVQDVGDDLDRRPAAVEGMACERGPRQEHERCDEGKQLERRVDRRDRRQQRANSRHDRHRNHDGAEPRRERDVMEQSGNPDEHEQKRAEQHPDGHRRDREAEEGRADRGQQAGEQEPARHHVPGSRPVVH